MSFTYTIVKGDAMGHAVVFGTYTNSTGGDTGGTITTGLQDIIHMSASSSTSTPSVVLTASAGTITLTTTANQDGTWMAIGR